MGLALSVSMASMGDDLQLCKYWSNYTPSYSEGPYLWVTQAARETVACTANVRSDLGILY